MVRTPLSLLVLCGGDSAERAVSLESGRCTAESLQATGHRVRLLDPADSCTDADLLQADIVIPMLHGRGGEDGSLQRRLQRLGIPWLGSSPEASELTFSKIRTRRLLQSLNLPVARGTTLHRGCTEQQIRQAAAETGFPLVVKPDEQGSSIGISLIHEEQQLGPAVQEAFRWGEQCVVEAFVAGREITVALAGDRLLPLVEIVPPGNWYDYVAKYQSAATQYRVAPAGIPAALPVAAIQAVRAAGASDLTRTDIRLRPDGSFVILEINTIPGMTTHSLVPLAAAALGLTIGQLLEPLLQQKLGSDRSAA